MALSSAVICPKVVKLASNPMRVGFGFEEHLGQRLGHLPVAHLHLQPAGFDLRLFLVAEVGDEDEILFGDDADRIVAGEIGQIRPDRARW